MIRSLAHTGGIRKAQRHSVEIDGFRQYVPRRAWDRRHDRAVRSGQCVQQAGLAHVGPPNQRGRHAFSHDAPVFRGLDEPLNALGNLFNASGQGLR